MVCEDISFFATQWQILRYLRKITNIMLMLYKLSANLENSSVLVEAQRGLILISHFHSIVLTVLQRKLESIEFQPITDPTVGKQWSS